MKVIFEEAISYTAVRQNMIRIVEYFNRMEAAVISPAINMHVVAQPQNTCLRMKGATIKHK